MLKQYFENVESTFTPHLLRRRRPPAGGGSAEWGNAGSGSESSRARGWRRCAWAQAVAGVGARGEQSLAGCGGPRVTTAAAHKGREEEACGWQRGGGRAAPGRQRGPSGEGGGGAQG